MKKKAHLAALLLAPLFALALVGRGEGAVGAQLPEGFFRFVTTPQDIISGLGWVLGYFGMPHIIIRFMSIKSEKELRKSSVIGISWTTIILTMSALTAVAGRLYLGGNQ